MCNIGMRALVPVKRGGVDDTLAIRNDWGLIPHALPCRDGDGTTITLLWRVHEDAEKALRKTARDGREIRR